MLIAIDHGNKAVKVSRRAFSAGLNESGTRPPFGEDVLHYNGVYYTTSDQRIPYLPDKTIDRRFFVLTLFAIAYELEAAGTYTPGTVIDVQLAVGLPPSHYGRLYKIFEAYFRSNHTEDFMFRGKPYSVRISEVIAYPQAYAAAMTIFSSIKDASKVIVLDIGGWTADYIQIKSGKHDLSVCDSLENGVIHLYNRVRSKVSSESDFLLDESDIDAILLGKNTEYPNTVCQIVGTAAQSFVNDLFATMRERMIDLKTGKTVFVGGGSMLLKRQILNSDKVGAPLFVEDISANAKGYELLYRAQQLRR